MTAVGDFIPCCVVAEFVGHCDCLKQIHYLPVVVELTHEQAMMELGWRHFSAAAALDAYFGG